MIYFKKRKLYKYIRIRDSASYDDHVKENESNMTKLIRSHLVKKVPKVVATCFCSRKSFYYISNAYFLIFLITVSAFNIFSIDCKLPANRIHINSVLLLTSVSFKWVINRSLPTVSYLTSLDKYAIVCIFYICMLGLWHSIVGSFWSKADAVEIDKWALLTFACFFVLIHVGLAIWFIVAYRHVIRIRRKEKEFLQKLRQKTFMGSRTLQNIRSI